jgi:hypothetical protein
MRRLTLMTTLEGIYDDAENVVRGCESRWGCSILFVFDHELNPRMTRNNPEYNLTVTVNEFP